MSRRRQGKVSRREALALMGLNQFDEAQDVIKQGVSRGLDQSGFHNRLYLIAILKGESHEAQRHVEWFSGKPDEYQMLEIQARAFAFAGQRRQAHHARAHAGSPHRQAGLAHEVRRCSRSHTGRGSAA